jgi:hypothetical protein
MSKRHNNHNLFRFGSQLSAPSLSFVQHLLVDQHIFYQQNARIFGGWVLSDSTVVK